MIRTYDFHAFPPRDGVDAFNLAQEQKRNLWITFQQVQKYEKALANVESLGAG